MTIDIDLSASEKIDVDIASKKVVYVEAIVSGRNAEIIAIPNNYTFETDRDRDLYFKTHMYELKYGLWILVGGQLYRWLSSWVEFSVIIKGDQGIPGVAGPQGEPGPKGADGVQTVNNIEPVNGNVNVSIWISRAAYNAIATPDPNIEYLIYKEV